MSDVENLQIQKTKWIKISYMTVTVHILVYLISVEVIHYGIQMKLALTPSLSFVVSPLQLQNQEYYLYNASHYDARFFESLCRWQLTSRFHAENNKNWVLHRITWDILCIQNNTNSPFKRRTTFPYFVLLQEYIADRDIDIQVFSYPLALRVESDRLASYYITM